MAFFLEVGWFIRQHKWRYLTIVLAIITASICSLLPPLMIAKLVDKVALQQNLGWAELWPTLAQLLLLAFATYGLRYLWRLCLFSSALELERQLLLKLYGHCCNMPAAFFRRHGTGKLLNHLNADINLVSQGVGNGVIFMVDAFVMSTLVVIVLATQLNALLTVCVLLPLPIMAWALKRYGKQMHDVSHQSQQALGNYYQNIEHTLSGMQVLKSHGYTQSQQAKVTASLETLTHANIAQSKIEAKYEPTTSLVAAASFLLTLAVGSVLVRQGHMSLGELLAFNLYLGYLIWPMNAFGFLFNTLALASVSLQRVNHVLNEKWPVAANDDGDVSMPEADLLEIHLPQGFKHENRDTNALHPLLFTLSKGQFQGIVGPIGSGKSSLLQLLLGQLKTEQQPCYLHANAKVAYVPQELALFSGSLKDNLTLAKQDATMAEIRQACQLACIDQDIQLLPMGYNTLLTESGHGLSGGQKQRLSIARAILSDAEVLLLDDCFSALDALTCRQLMVNLKCWLNDERAIVLTSSRLGLMRHCDSILELSERNHNLPHDALMAQGTWYSLHVGDKEA
ncbi:ABC transporter ATP-binding protein [Motilimonas pumila]|uniref:ATP-binding cassette domain-containing protein n=1 Tax=Motilimonas pumila TaxID=2303987 RepID=A0A418YD19_9GAMM|nr:ABC transporter transmembrane domain-containing protein [Motilimonas pumila]RJG42428.1 ATP-binding cassette domain-containing protein [Motilimonas pumila]